MAITHAQIEAGVRAEAAPTTGAARDDSWRQALTWTAAACLFGAEVIHAEVMDEHFAQWAWAGAFFLAVALVEGLLGAGLLVRPSRRLMQVGVWVSLATIALWAVSRTTGLPFGPHPWRPEPAGAGDVVATAFELVTTGTLLGLLQHAAGWPARNRLLARYVVPALVVVTVAALTLVAVNAPVHGHL